MCLRGPDPGSAGRTHVRRHERVQWRTSGAPHRAPRDRLQCALFSNSDSVYPVRAAWCRRAARRGARQRHAHNPGSPQVDRCRSDYDLGCGPRVTESPTADVTILPDGSFTFNNVPPGSYQIRGRAHTVAGGASLFALYRVVLVDHDVTVRLVLLPGARVSGTISADAERTAKPATFAALRIQAPFADGSSFGDALTGDTLANGSFTIHGVDVGQPHHNRRGLARSLGAQGSDVSADGTSPTLG